MSPPQRELRIANAPCRYRGDGPHNGLTAVIFEFGIIVLFAQIRTVLAAFSGFRLLFFFFSFTSKAFFEYLSLGRLQSAVSPTY